MNANNALVCLVGIRMTIASVMELQFILPLKRLIKYKALRYHRSRGSSVSIVSDYGLDDRAIGVRFSAGAKDFSSNLCVQTGSEAHPVSCTMGQSAAGT
jgi:hypothetical protein